MRWILTVSLPLAFAGVLWAEVLPKAKLEAVPTKDEHKEVLRAAMAAHDRRDFHEAVLRYNGLLADNPHDVSALYELSYTYIEMKEFQRAFDVAMRGAEYKSGMLPILYMNIGTALDLMGKPKKATRVYREAIKRYPQTPKLHYNLAVTYLTQQKDDKAKPALKNALSLNPSHGSSHIALAQLYSRQQEKIPALLAVSRFLLLEPATGRTPGALELLGGLLGSGVSRQSESNYTITIGSTALDGTEEGDFGGAEMALNIHIAASTIKKDGEEEKTKAAIVALAMGGAFLALPGGEEEDAPRGFATEYYAPFFREMESREFTEPFVYYILQTTSLPEVKEWLVANAGKVEEFLIWARSYEWPRPALEKL